MKIETRLAALRAAGAIAGIAGSAGFGCSPAPPPEAATVPASDVPSRPVAPASSLTPRAEPCNVIVDRFFPGDHDPYDPKPVSAPADVERCCVAALQHESAPSAPPAEVIPGESAKDYQRIFTRHRWGCCNVADTERHRNVPMACTPWGPPVPPPMRRRLASA